MWKIKGEWKTGINRNIVECKETSKPLTFCESNLGINRNIVECKDLIDADPLELHSN